MNFAVTAVLKDFMRGGWCTGKKEARTQVRRARKKGCEARRFKEARAELGFSFYPFNCFFNIMLFVAFNIFDNVFNLFCQSFVFCKIN